MLTVQVQPEIGLKLELEQKFFRMQLKFLRTGFKFSAHG